MRKIIESRLYDTETARSCGSWENTWDSRDFHYICETLYRKKTGEFFLYGQGGAMTKYARAVEQNSWSSGERIMPLTYAQAQSWAEEHLSADEYADIFGMPDEGEDRQALNIRLTAPLMAKLKARAAENATSVTATVEAMLTSLFDKE